MHQSRRLRRLVTCITLLGTALLAGALHAGDTLNSVHARDELRCGVSEGIHGFSRQDDDGEWRGLDVDFCRAVAAAALGDPQKVRFVPLRASARFPALKSRSIDLLSRNTSWTLTREAILQMQFPAVLFYDGQTFMLPRAAGVEHLAELKQGSVCVEKDTTHLDNLREYARSQGLQLSPLVLDSAPEAAAAFFSGRCQAYSSDAAQLAAARLGAPGQPQDFVILAEHISKEPLGPVVTQGDEQWTSAVRWVLFVLLLAEEHGITQANAEARIGQLQGSVGRLLRGEDRSLAQALGLQPDWALRAIRAGGNYAELYTRNLGEHSPLNIERGLNRLWNQGGLMYAPPIN
jgi:general L-amino acid transport system substrate-binding protein